MPSIDSSKPYLQTLLYDLGRRGHTTGSLALSPGRHAVYGGRYIDVEPETRAYVAALAVNPHLRNERSPGLVAYMSPVPVLRLPPNVQTHLGIKSLHLDSRGDMRLQGELGGQHHRLLNYTHGPVSLEKHLNALDKHFTDICSKVAQHPLFSDVDAFDLGQSDLTWTFEGGPTLAFDAEGRLPFKGLRSDRTEVSLRPEPDDARQMSPLTIRVNHYCTLLATQGPDREVVIELYASLGASQERPAPAEAAEQPDGGQADEHDGLQRRPSNDSNSDAASDDGDHRGIPGAAAPAHADRATYCAAIYAGLLNTFNMSGHLSVAERDWTDVAALFPKAEAHVRGWKMRCRSSVRVNLQRQGNDLHLEADKPIHLSLPEALIPVRLGWLRRLLSRLLVVSVREASISLAAPPGDLRGHLPFAVQSARLQLGWIPIPFVRVNRQFDIPLPPPPALFAQLDYTASKIAQVYTFSPLVNLSHLTDLSRSDFGVTSDRYCQCDLSETYALQARATSLELGQSTHHGVGGRLAIDHEAGIVGPDSERDLRLGATFSIQGGALPLQPFVGDDPVGPSIQIGGDDETGVALHATLGPEATQALIKAAAGGLKGLAGKSARVFGKGIKTVLRAGHRNAPALVGDAD